MSELTPRAKQLLKEGQPDLNPTSVDKARIRERLQSRLPTSQTQQSGGSIPALKTPALSWPLVSTLTLTAGALVGAIYWGIMPESGQETPEAINAIVIPEWLPTTPPQIGDLDPSPAALTLSMGSSALAKTPPIRKAERKDTTNRRLGEEVELLSRATSALHSGRASDALQVLEEHRNAFPRGALTVERLGARAQALCLLGRRQEAQAELARLPAASPQAARARAFCNK